MTKRGVPFLLLVFFVLSLKGQPYYFRQYQADDGLSHNTANRIIQDRLGFIWIGTKGGLDRFDGNSFKNIPLNPKRAGANNVVSLREDHSGTIWVGTRVGLFRLSPQNEDCEEVAGVRGRVAEIKVDPANNIWFITGGQLYMYNSDAAEAIPFQVDASAIDISDAGDIWIGTHRGEVKKLTAGVTGVGSATLLEQPGEERVNHGLITRLAVVGDQLMVGTTRGLYRVNRLTGKWSPLLTKDSKGADVYVRDIQVVEHTATCYIATESGLFIYDYQHNRLQSVDKIWGDPYSLNDNALYTVCVDNREGVWVGTFFGGVNYYSRENSSFEKYYPVSDRPSISGNAVREIYGDEGGNIWIGTEDAGITRFNPAKGEFEHLAFADPGTGFSYPNIHGLLANEGHLYIGPFVHGFEVMDIASGKVLDRYPLIQTDNKLFSSNFVMSIYKTAGGEILVGTTGAGLHRFDPVARTLRQVNEIRHDSYVYAIFEDHAGTIWTGSLSSGAFFFNPKTGEHGNINFSTDSADRRFHTVQGIYEDDDHTLWFTSDGGGLIRLDSNRTDFRRYTKADGLPTDYTYRVLEDNDGMLWISSLKGLICFNPNTEDVFVYTKANGLTTDQFNYNSAYKAPDGKMYFGTVNGMIAFTPEHLVKNQVPPPLHITGLQIGNTKIVPGDSTAILRQSMLFTDSISLEYDQSTFEIEFAALDFSSSSAIRYTYRMEGFDHKWTHLTTNRKAYYTGLPAGTYRFVVQAESNVGYWKTPPTTLVVRVLPPFWKSWPAYVCYALVLISVVALLVWYYHRSVRRRNARQLKLFELEKEKEVYRAKIDFFTNIAHEIRTPLTLIKGPVEWAYERATNATTVRRNLKLVKSYTDRLVALTTQLLDFRKTESSQVALQYVQTDINRLIHDLISDFKPAAEKRHIAIRMFEPPLPLTAVVDREAFVKIVSNLLSNAVKYADRYVSVEWDADTDATQFTLTVANDGERIPAEYREKVFEPFFRVPNQMDVQGTGIGLSLARSLAELHGGTLEALPDETGLNVFVLTIPISGGTDKFNTQKEAEDERNVAHH